MQPNEPTKDDFIERNSAEGDDRVKSDPEEVPAENTLPVPENKPETQDKPTKPGDEFAKRNAASR